MENYIITISRRFASRGHEIAGLMSLFRREIRDEIRDEAQLEFERQSEVLRSLVREGPCIILGRCADQVFEDEPRALHIFIYASREDRIRNVMEMLHTGEEEAKVLILNEDRARDKYRRRFSSHPEDEVTGRHILIDSGKLGAVKSADLLVQAAQYLFFD